jgi:hypothetical protein
MPTVALKLDFGHIADLGAVVATELLRRWNLALALVVGTFASALHVGND